MILYITKFLGHGYPIIKMWVDDRKIFTRKGSGARYTFINFYDEGQTGLWIGENAFETLGEAQKVAATYYQWNINEQQKTLDVWKAKLEKMEVDDRHFRQPCTQQHCTARLGHDGPHVW